ncbi:hypothetical protein [Larkinella terrae]|uniref:Uncharacterized protein n=1 Tax=Larkinella terrae TaxID=2025311 RepID=A0A7K0EGT7_9BACT|nr:hypothetical protein [Larkinella terrae]MRS60668.1 hypothetical protein [Larkinella terrae]
MTSKLGYSHSGPKSSLRPSDIREPRQPDWLLILMVSFFVLTLLIAWLVDIPALLR